jgi:hypothetical protein
MEIISDFYKLNLEVIASLKQQGFLFEEYSEWKKRKGNNITSIISQKKSTIEETDLTSAYEKDLVLSFANWLERIPDPIPRKIYKCKHFSCPPQYRAGLTLLEKDIINGENLLPYLSRQVIDPKKNDRMLFNLGIIHFHLGLMPAEKNKKFVKGGNDILYGFINDQSCYFIAIDKHGRWDDEKLLEMLNNDFPEVLKPWKLNDISPARFSDADKTVLRSKNVNFLVTINNEAYAPPGWGTSTMGTSMHAQFNLFRFIHFLDNLEKELRILLNEQQSKIEGDFNKKITCMKLSLIKTDPIIIFDKENYLFIDNIVFDDKNPLSVNISNDREKYFL